MSSEAGLWAALQKHAGPLLHLRRVENRCDKGTPDVAWCGRLPDGRRHGVTVYRTRSGWLELKEGSWPARPSTPLHLPKLYQEQPLWALAWERAGGHAAALLQLDRDYLLVPPAELRAIYHRARTRAQLAEYVLGSGAFPTTELLRRLFA